MNNFGFLFIGRSGCGKGTQAKLLREKLGNKNTVYISVGEQLRKFFARDNYTSKLSEKISNKGNLQPSFFAVWAWTDGLIDKMKKNKHLIIDGAPRMLKEAYYIEEAVRFYNFKKVRAILLNVSKEWATKRLLERKRNDDNKKAIKTRLDYYEKDVMPVVEYFKSKGQLIDINGEQTIEKVHEDIIKKLR